MVETVMEVEELGDELADLDTLEETIASGMQPGGVNAPDSDKKSMGRKAAEYSVDAIPDLDDLDALEQSITAQSGAVPNLEPEPEPEQADDTAPQATERKQFQGLKVGELKQRARAIGVSTGAIDAAIDQADDPKEALIGLILAIKPRTGCAKYLPLCCVRDWWTEDVHPAKQEELAHVFAYFDVDGSGSVDRHELRAVIQDLFEGGHVRHPSDEIVDSLMEAGDKDGDGSIDFPEFMALVTSADLDLHPSLCDRCQNPRRERRCFLRKKPGVRCGPPDDEKFDPQSLPHLAFWVLAKSIMVHTAIGIVLLVLALGADGDVKLSSGLSALMVILASFGLTLTYAGVPASRCWFGVYLLVLIAQVCVSNVLLVPHIFDKACVVNGEEVHDACPAFITSSDQVRDAKDACLAAKNDLNQSYCSFKTDCDLRRTKAGCESALTVYGTVECTWRVDNSGEDGFCNATSAETRLSVIGGTCLSSVACRFQKLLAWLSIIYTVVVATSMLAVVLVLIDSLKPHQLPFASGEQSPWEQALMMSMDVGLHHKQRKGLVSVEYGTKQRPSKFAADMYSKDNDGPPPPVSKRTLGM